MRYLYRLIPLLLTLFGLLLLAARLATAAPDAPPSAPSWSAATLLSQPSKSSTVPKVAASPNGATVMVAFNQENNNVSVNNDPYYVVSNDNGATWTPAPLPIHSSPTIASNSLFIDIAYDAGGAAHAVWNEALALVYSNNRDYTWPTNNSSNPPLQLIAADIPGASDPEIVVTGSIVDVIWSQGSNFADPVIRHARSSNGGASFAINQAVNASTTASRVPDLAVDPLDPNTLYAVWEEQVTGITSTIFFAEGSVSGSTISWTPPAQITPSNSNDVQPEIVANSRGLHVVYNHKVANPGGGDVLQLVYYVRCTSSDCTQFSNWTLPINASGQFVSVNSSDPFDIVSALVDYNDCRYVYYHGTDINLAQQTELIWGVNSCDGWQAGGVERVTDPIDIRAINPDVATGPGGWIYMVYGRADTTERQVYVLSAQADPSFKVLLPVIRRR